MSDAKVTTNHSEIQRWTEERGGFPARVKGTDKGNKSGIIRIDYQGFSGTDTLEKITWEEFFDAFEKNKLAFLFQDTVSSGEKSRFSKLIDRESDEAKGH